MDEEIFLVEQVQGDLVVERTVTVGIDYEILEDFEGRFPSDEIRVFPCEIDEGYTLEETELEDPEAI